jgi:signal peptidase I
VPPSPDPQDAATPSRTSGRQGWKFLRDLAIIVVAALLASFLVKTFVVRSFYIPSQSMEHTLLVGDHLLVNELVPGVAPLRRGDVVVFDDPGGWLGPGQGNDLIKRVIGLPGDTVSCCDAQGRLSVNGHPVDEPYVQLPAGTDAVSGTSFRVTVPAGRLWVMGDNRYDSADSRVHGYVRMRDVVGRAFVITWPVDRWAVISRHADSWDAVPDPR